MMMDAFWIARSINRIAYLRLYANFSEEQPIGFDKMNAADDLTHPVDGVSLFG
jgi:hypothetical protein